MSGVLPSEVEALMEGQQNELQPNELQRDILRETHPHIAMSYDYVLRCLRIKDPELDGDTVQECIEGLEIARILVSSPLPDRSG